MTARTLVTAICAFLLASLAPAQIILPGTIWSVFEERKGSVGGIGKDEDSGILQIEFLQGNQFTAFDAALQVTYRGSYVPKGKGFEYTLDGPSLATLAAGYERWIEAALRGLGLPLDVTVNLTKYQGKAKLKFDRRSGVWVLFLQSKSSFEVSAPGYRPRKGKASTRAIGTQIT